VFCCEGANTVVDADGTGVRAVDVGEGVEVADGLGVLVALGVGVAFGVVFGDVVAFGVGVAVAAALAGVEGVAAEVVAAEVVVTAAAVDDGEAEGATTAVDAAAEDAGALPLETALDAGATAPELDAGAAELAAAEAADDADAEWCLLLQPASASTTIMEPATTADPRRARVRVTTLLEPDGDSTDDLLRNGSTHAGGVVRLPHTQLIHSARSLIQAASDQKDREQTTPRQSEQVNRSVIYCAQPLASTSSVRRSAPAAAEACREPIR
jgi:hypothetical protein